MRRTSSVRPRGPALGWVGGLVLLVLAVRSLPAQAIGQGFELEREGRFAQAAAIYFAALRADPTDLSALLGLERVLPGLGRLPELLAIARRASAASPANVALRGVLLRTYVGLNEPDSARAVAQRWIGAAPGDEAPYREWAMALEDLRSHAAARAVLEDGRRALQRPGAFGIELAELAARSGDWEGAAREWATALDGAATQLPNAVSELGEASPPQRERIARALTAGDPPPLTRRLAGELLLNWGEPERAWTVYAPSLATRPADAAVAAHHFADVAALRATPAARRVRALALARYAELAPGPVAVRARAEAARALLEVGDRSAARGVLEGVARDSAAPADAQALAQTTLVETLIDAGQLDDAAQRLARDDRLTEGDRATLRLRLARGRIAQGDLDRADATVGRDSSVEALALKGWIALYRGRLHDAERLFLAAGPYAGDRRDATDRTEMLALLERVAADSFAELGGALLALARGDSVRAATALRHAADQALAAGSGRPDILLLAGRVAARLGPPEQQAALAMFAEVVRTDGSAAAAPAAELEWARLLEVRLQPADAIQHLEHLILSYPRSAVVPEARRELDRAKGAIPKS
jgi:tetratricopeptide (TPR) repeat protein